METEQLQDDISTCHTTSDSLKDYTLDQDGLWRKPVIQQKHSKSTGDMDVTNEVLPQWIHRQKNLPTWGNFYGLSGLLAFRLQR